MKQPVGGVPEKTAPKIWEQKGRGLIIDNDKNVKKLPPNRLLDFLIIHITERCK